MHDQSTIGASTGDPAQVHQRVVQWGYHLVNVSLAPSLGKPNGNNLSRSETILRHVNLNGTGLEVGPGHEPIAPKSAGFNVEVIDHLSREGLVAKYSGHGLSVEKIEEVDHIWNGQSYADLTGKPDSYDFVIASHVIEHVPDVIGFLQSCEGVLRPGGVVTLAVPDYRYCFDMFREPTSLAQILDAHLDGRTAPSAGSVAEFKLLTATNGDALSWDPLTTDINPRFIHKPDEASADFSRLVGGSDEYIDTHVWCFTPAVFALAIEAAAFFKLSSFEIEEVSAQGAEFYVTLRKTTPRSTRSIDIESLVEARKLERQPVAVPAEPDPTTNLATESQTTNLQLIEELRNEIQAIRATKSYRLVEPLRRLERARRQFARR